MTKSQVASDDRVPKEHHETADDYYCVIAQLNACWRVIESCDGIQWILQVKRGERGGRPRWTGRKYIVGRAELLRISHILCGEIDPEAAVKLAALPPIFRRKGSNDEQRAAIGAHIDSIDP